MGGSSIRYNELDKIEYFSCINEYLLSDAVLEFPSSIQIGQQIPLVDARTSTQPNILIGGVWERSRMDSDKLVNALLVVLRKNDLVKEAILR